MEGVCEAAQSALKSTCKQIEAAAGMRPVTETEERREIKKKSTCKQTEDAAGMRPVTQTEKSREII